MKMSVQDEVKIVFQQAIKKRTGIPEQQILG